MRAPVSRSRPASSAPSPASRGRSARRTPALLAGHPELAAKDHAPAGERFRDRRLFLEPGASARALGGLNARAPALDPAQLATRSRRWSPKAALVPARGGAAVMSAL